MKLAAVHITYVFKLSAQESRKQELGSHAEPSADPRGKPPSSPAIPRAVERLWELLAKSGVVFHDAQRTAAGIDRTPRNQWVGSATVLHLLLTDGTCCALTPDERAEVRPPVWLARVLGLCQQHLGPDVCRQLPRTRSGRSWRLRPLPVDPATVRDTTSVAPLLNNSRRKMKI